MKTWYEGNTGDHQGLVIDEQTGENIAVTYKKETAALISAAPELLEICKILDDLLASRFWHTDKKSSINWDKVRREINTAIQKAEGN